MTFKKIVNDKKTMQFFIEANLIMTNEGAESMFPKQGPIIERVS